MQGLRALSFVGEPLSTCISITDPPTLSRSSQVVASLAAKHPQLLFLSIEAEEQPDIAESFDIEAVPTFLLLRVSPDDIHLLLLLPGCPELV